MPRFVYQLFTVYQVFQVDMPDPDVSTPPITGGPL